MSAAPSTDVDLVVAGGGPAGLATAIHAVRAGLDVVVVEPRSGPIDKACGEGLLPGATRALAALGASVEGRPLVGIRYLDDSHAAEARFRHGTGLGVRRTTLHAALAELAAAEGVRVEHGRVHEVRQLVGAVEVDGRTARHLVAADGLHSPVRGTLGLGGPPPRVRRYGVRRHYAVAPWTDLVEVHWAPGLEIYVTPVADDLVGVAVLGPRGATVDDALAAVPRLQRRLTDAAQVGTDRGAGPLAQSVRRRTAGRVLLVGDAAGYVDAVTGEGVHLALEQAAAAVACVVRDRADAYEARWRAITARHRYGTRSLLAATANEPLRRALVPAAQRFPHVFGWCVDVVTSSPRVATTS